MTEMTTLFVAAKGGNTRAIGEIYARLYSDLRLIAHSRIRQLDNRAMIDTTSLVHESYIKLIKTGSLAVENRNEFLSYASSVMRSVVVDFIRQSLSQQRGGGQIHVTLNSNLFDAVESPAEEIIRLSEFLDVLKTVDQRLVSIVEMRYFAALENGEIAETLGVTDRTVRRDLEKARLLFADDSR
jgi:RNA polymerase sigma factor (TIGR02999 family)